MKTLQEQYNLIKEGKGNKEILLKTAKQLYPNIIPNHFTYNQAVPLLKQRGLLHESIGGVVTKGTDPDWFAIFKKNINEAKAIEKKPTKEVVDMETKGFDYKNKENIDNVYGQAFLIGYYAEMKDPKNADKTVDDLKAIVAKNLYKDPLYYVKNGQFGVKGVGYTDEAPGLKASKTDQMTPVPDQVKPRASKTDLGDREKKTGAAKGIKGEMTVTPKSSKGVKKMPLPGKEKKIKLQENIDVNLIDKYVNDVENSGMSADEAYSFLFQQGLNQEQVDMIMGYAFPKTTSEQKIRSVISQLIKEELEEAWDTMGQGYGEEGMYSPEEKWNSLTPEEQEELLMTFIQDPDEAFKYVGAEFSMLPDVVISNMDNYFINEVTYQMGTNLGSFSGKKRGGDGEGEGGNRKIPRVLFISKSVIESINNLHPGSIRLISKDKDIYMYVSDMFINALNELERGRTSYEKESKKSSLARLISDKIPSAVRSKIKKETNPKKDTGLNMHYVNLLLANNKDRTGYWILIKAEFDPLMRETETIVSPGAKTPPAGMKPEIFKTAADKATKNGKPVSVVSEEEAEDLDYNPEMFDDVYYQQIEDLENELAKPTDPERKKELQAKIDYLMKNIM